MNGNSCTKRSQMTTQNFEASCTENKESRQQRAKRYHWMKRACPVKTIGYSDKMLSIKDSCMRILSIVCVVVAIAVQAKQEQDCTPRQVGKGESRTTQRCRARYVGWQATRTATVTGKCGMCSSTSVNNNSPSQLDHLG